MEIEPQDVSALPLYNNSNHLASFFQIQTFSTDFNVLQEV